MSVAGWKKLMDGFSLVGRGRYPIPAYSEFMPPVRLGCRPYSGEPDGLFSEEDPFGWPVTEFDEAFELRPGMANLAHQVLGALQRLVYSSARPRMIWSSMASPWPAIARYGRRIPICCWMARGRRGRRFTLP